MATRFSNQQLIIILGKAAAIVSLDLCLSGTNQITVDASGCVSNPANDPHINALVLMQAECLISQTDFASELSSGALGLLIKDGEQTVDNRAKSVARGTFFDSPFSPCAQYEKRIKLVKMDRLGNGGGGKLVY